MTRSEWLARGSLATTGTFLSVYENPTGKRSLLKQIDLSWGGAAPDTVLLAVFNAASTAFLYDIVTLAPSSSYHRECFLMMEEGDTLQVRHSSALDSIYFYLSGAELPSP